jgi:hypothetical protein
MAKLKDILEKNEQEYKEWNNDDPIRRAIKEKEVQKEMQKQKIIQNKKETDFYKKLMFAGLYGILYTAIAGVLIFFLIILFAFGGETFPTWLMYLILIAASIIGLHTGFQK